MNKRNWKNKMCVLCGREFSPTSGRQKYCPIDIPLIKKERTRNWIKDKNSTLSIVEEPTYCSCGCGSIITVKYRGRTYNRLYLNGHNNKGVKFTEEHKLNMSKSMNKGLTPLIKLIRTEDKYKKWRHAVFERDNFTCQITKIKGNKNLVAHHIINLSSLILQFDIKTVQEAYECNELWDIENGITMLKDVHHSFHNTYGRRDNNLSQVSEFKNDVSSRICSNRIKNTSL